MTQGVHFLKLARSLGVRIVAPMTIEHRGVPTSVDAFFPDFGGPKGMIILINESLDIDDLDEIAQAAGFFWSALNARAPIDETSVIETFNDWGYYGPAEQRPTWCTENRRTPP